MLLISCKLGNGGKCIKECPLFQKNVMKGMHPLCFMLSFKFKLWSCYFVVKFAHSYNDNIIIIKCNNKQITRKLWKLIKTYTPRVMGDTCCTHLYLTPLEITGTGGFTHSSTCGGFKILYANTYKLMLRLVPAHTSADAFSLCSDLLIFVLVRLSGLACLCSYLVLICSYLCSCLNFCLLLCHCVPIQWCNNISVPRR
jgi:hypothetical protein